MAGQQAGNPNGRRYARGGEAGGGIVASKNARAQGWGPWARAIIDDRARALIRGGADAAGFPLGALRGVYHTGKDIWDGANFLIKAMHPVLDEGAALADGVGAGVGLVDYAKNVFSHPKVVLDDVGDSLRRFRVKVDPNASPPAASLRGELARNFNIGLNQGEAAFDVGSLLLGGAEAKALAGPSKMSEAAKAAKLAKDMARFRARGYPENVVKRFVEPYDGMGSHLWPRAKKLPALLGGERLPRVISDSRFNVLMPPGINTGDMYELHFGVDPRYFGGKIGEEFGGGSWSGRKLGWTKRNKLGRILHGSPKPLKYTVGGGIFGSAGALVDQYRTGEEQP